MHKGVKIGIIITCILLTIPIVVFMDDPAYDYPMEQGVVPELIVYE